MKDLANVVTITDGNMAKVGQALADGKTVELAVEKGPMVSEMLKTGYSDFLKAYAELVTEGHNLVTCGCGKPANVMVLLWRD